MKTTLLTALLSCFLLTACGGDEEAAPVEEKEEAAKPAKKKVNSAEEKEAKAAELAARQEKKEASELAKLQGGVLVIGDSLSAAEGLSSDQVWPGLMRKRLLASSNVAVVNASINGDNASGGASRVQWQLGKYNPKVVVVALGSRDIQSASPVSSMKPALDLIIRTIQANKATVVLAGVHAPTSAPAEYQAEVAAMYSDLAQLYKVQLVPDLAAPLVRAEMMGATAAETSKMTIEAQPAIMETVWPAVQEAIRVSGATAPAPDSSTSKKAPAKNAPKK